MELPDYNRLRTKIRLLMRARVNKVNFKDGYEEHIVPITSDDNDYLSEAMRLIGKVSMNEIEQWGVSYSDVEKTIQQGRILAPTMQDNE